MFQQSLSRALGLALSLSLCTPLLAQDELGDLVSGLTNAEREGLEAIHATYTIECEVVFPELVGDEESLHLGAFQSATRLSHFDVVRDTPGFDNGTASSLGHKVGSGACLGIAKLIAKSYHELHWPGPGEEPIEFSFHGHRFENLDHPDLRAMTLDETHRQGLFDALKQYTQYAGQHVVNFFRGIGGWGDEECYQRILEYLERDELPIVLFKGGNIGWHATNAYKALHFSHRSIIYFHENNVVYQSDSDFIPLFVLIYDHETKTLSAPNVYGNVDIKVTGI